MMIITSDTNFGTSVTLDAPVEGSFQDEIQDKLETNLRDRQFSLSQALISVPAQYHSLGIIVECLQGFPER